VSSWGRWSTHAPTYTSTLAVHCNQPSLLQAVDQTILSKYWSPTFIIPRTCEPLMVPSLGRYEQLLVAHGLKSLRVRRVHSRDHAQSHHLHLCFSLFTHRKMHPRSVIRVNIAHKRTPQPPALARHFCSDANRSSVAFDFITLTTTTP
jgi:hypothetical protein